MGNELVERDCPAAHELDAIEQALSQQGFAAQVEKAVANPKRARAQQILP